MNANSDVSVTFWTDPDDAPELGQDFFERADLYDGTRLIRSGKRLATPSAIIAHPVIDSDIIEKFSASGPGWQGRMNDVLRDWLQRRQPL